MEEQEMIEWVLRHTRHISSGKCEIEESIPGPHPGCAEFAPEEIHLCSNPATTLMVIQDSAEPDPDCYQLCDSHVRKMRADTQSLFFTILREEQI